MANLPLTGYGHPTRMLRARLLFQLTFHRFHHGFKPTAPVFFSTKDPKSPGGGVSKIVSHVLDVTESYETKCQCIF
jgi:hypothetical protein